MSENQPDNSGTQAQTFGDDDAEQEVVRLASQTDEDGHSSARRP